MSSTPAAPTPAAPEKLTVQTVLKDITVVLGSIATVGEAVLVALPSGPVNSIAAIAMPVLVALVAGLRKIGG
jgi:hypothetical protein